MTPTIDAYNLDSVHRLSDRLTAEYLEHNGILPLEFRDGQLVLATWNGAPNPRALDDLRLLFDAEPALVLLPEADLRAAIHRAYGSEPATAEALIQGMTGANGIAVESASGGKEPAIDDLVNQANEAPVIRLVNMLLLEALDSRVSDIHLEQNAGGLVVRYRVDGVLQDAPSPPAVQAAAVVSRLKIMADLDIAERRLPQDGRMRLRLKEREVDVRVSTIPVLHGESVVLRLLDQRQGRIRLEQLGMPPGTLAAFLGAIRRPNGIVLATGPTGSGKTTTLYAAIELLATGREKILTVEDPVEYELDGVAQVPVNMKIGLTFARALRSLLRQDPDVLLVGEIRDAETAEIATHAALTGHLVLSTLHTNDAATAVTRLLDLGVAPYLVASTVEAILAQRLVRRVCDSCAVERALTEDEALVLGGGSTPEPGPSETLPDRVREGAGCAVCRGTGFLGRTGIYELLRVTDTIREEIHRRPGSVAIRHLAIQEGMRTLRRDAVRVVSQGSSTPAEVCRVTM